MKKLKRVRFFPISQHDLAAYLGISSTLLSMTQTGRHGARQLNSAATKKRRALVAAYQGAQKLNTHGASLRKMQEYLADDYNLLAESMMRDADYADAHARILKRRLDVMANSEQQDQQWLNTLDLLLATLPNTSESVRDRKWLEVQQAFASERLHKNGRLRQVKLEVQIEMEKARARVYRDVRKKLLKK
ncbi:MAG TPA: hypothetical protein VGO58_13845 [Chitinophagaceae bacterium]|jgi:hypothetical protein|nr:hypothetical protein [Chitinophagaceae bacterium]